MKKNILKVFLVLSLLTSIQAQAENTKPAPLMMSMTDITGKTYTVEGTTQGLEIQGLEGKITFIEFFGHQCPPCLASIPHLVKLKEKYKDTLSIISIEVQGLNNEQLKKFVADKSINYTVFSEGQAIDVVRYLQQRAQWTGSIPFLVVLDTKGDVQFVQAGMLPESSLEDIIKQLSNVSKEINSSKEMNTTKETNSSKETNSTK